MPVSTADRKVVEDLMHAMQAGPAGEETLLGLFAEDGVLVEPFTGKMQTHVGKQAIRASLREMSKTRAPDLKLMLDRVDVDGGKLRADWSCTSSILPAPMRGHDFFELRGGKISRLEIYVTEMPGMGP